MSGFRHDIAGGSGDLIATSVHSPNFRASPLTGWSIDKDGNAFFESVVIGGGVVRVTFAATAPASPNTGDVWFDLSNGAQPNVWNGSAWTSYTWGTNSIGTGAVTNTQLAASVTARSLGGITTTISGTQPASPEAGDIWIDSANGNQLNQWSGSAWVALSWTASDVISAGTIIGSLIAASTITGGLIAAGTITASNIAANTITASQIAAGAIGTGQLAANAVTAAKIAANTITAAQLAAGIVYAGIVDSTTIKAAEYIADGTSGEFLAYSGTPAAGNLIFSISGAATTDGAGNPVKAGAFTYSYDVNGDASGFISGRLSFLNSGGNGVQAGLSLAGNLVWFSTSGSRSIDVSALGLIAGTASFSGPVTATGGTTASPTKITTDSGTLVSSFGTGWAASGSAVNGVWFLLLPDGMVYCAIDVKTNSTTPGGTICTIPAAYVPNTNITGGHVNNPGTPANGSYSVTANSSGSLTISTPGSTSGTRYAGSFMYPGPAYTV